MFSCVYSQFAPDVIVVQCGADSCAQDPSGGANLTQEGYSNCIRKVLDKRKPTLLLGGGGYRHDNTARLWTFLTALVAGVDLDDLIPDHTHWPEYGPDYTLPMDATLVKDTNKSAYIEECIEKINANVMKYLAK